MQGGIFKNRLAMRKHSIKRTAFEGRIFLEEM